MFSLELSASTKKYFENLKEYLLINFGEKTKINVWPIVK